MLELQRVIWRSSGSDFRLFIPRLTIKSGITLLVGRNGAGKSSLLKLMATAQFPMEGDILYNGMTTARDLAVIRSSIGFVPTGIELYEEMRTTKLLHYLAELKGVSDPSQLDQLMADFNLTLYKTHKIKSLAQGIRQRIALAQAWIGTPAYLFLDEPLNALDSLERLQFIKYVATNARNRTIVISTHELNEWEAWADRVLWLDDGKTLFYGTVTEWSADLPLSVWEGRVNAAHYFQLDPAHVLHVREDEREFVVRYLGSEPPEGHFIKQITSLEDAYFIRCRSQRSLLNASMNLVKNRSS
ncbi:multidrug ABC transporter ATP-binding protein [Paenibacillus baekrokdamisoli]|uniref:Multidrug ABC transporter ATP-binding protein n=1 Tax=Paenibacillus baekrokdamisoli TaxID=1712516 RepID=A0A3G9JG75_9BACL|nr:ABC transporter ATP-binding protein [Paenibacillus baekrokdamisoli]MBB3069525.1 ABC-type multidrug transport system ATPase subunit [Paenibacillus baekrokdamisoli]BBH24901.1 multidrug ABC transporter ATP-binding protein [Paenibacillus baekrokdamisoli]